jgi:hypothetical protein
MVTKNARFSSRLSSFRTARPQNRFFRRFPQVVGREMRTPHGHLNRLVAGELLDAVALYLKDIAQTKIEVPKLSAPPPDYLQAIAQSKLEFPKLDSDTLAQGIQEATNAAEPPLHTFHDDVVNMFADLQKQGDDFGKKVFASLLTR